MNPTFLGPLRLHTQLEQWPLTMPFRIAGYTFEMIEVLVVTLQKDECVGRAEAAGIYYMKDRPHSMIQQIESLRATIEVGLDRNAVQKLLPPGGARNALDCALWDLEAKATGCPAWQVAGLDRPRPIVTTFTCSADQPAEVVMAARSYRNPKALKLKLTGESIDVERIRAVRESLPDVWMSIDANQGFSRSFLESLMPILVEEKVALIEQPFPRGQEELLDGFQSPIPIVADESVLSLADIPHLVGRFNMINIKLDKCGGLTEGLAMVRAAAEYGLNAMVGNMMGTSLAIAPAFVLGQVCNVADLDGCIFLKADRAITVQYNDGLVTCPDGLWG